MGLWLGLAAAAAYAVPALAAASLQASSARAALWLAWVLHGSALAWAMLEPTPRFGFASALSVTAWLVLTVYAIERQLFPQLQTRWALAALGSVFKDFSGEMRQHKEIRYLITPTAALWSLGRSGSYKD